MSSQTSSHQPNYYAVIPASVRYCKDLEPCARLLYGEITALCNQEGFCWARNKYFSDLYGVDDRTIRRWIESLSKNNFIFCEVDQGTFNPQRKIYLKESFKINDTVGQKCPDTRTKMSGHPDKNVRHNSTMNNTPKKQQQTPSASAAAFYKCTEGIGLTAKEQKSLMAYPEQKVSDAIKFATNPKTKIKTTLIKTIMWAIKEDPDIPEIVDEKANKKHAQNGERVLESKDWIMECKTTQVLFYSKNPYNSKTYEIKYDEEQFKIKMDLILKTCRFKVITY